MPRGKAIQKQPASKPAEAKVNGDAVVEPTNGVVDDMSASSKPKARNAKKKPAAAAEVEAAAKAAEPEVEKSTRKGSARGKKQIKEEPPMKDEQESTKGRGKKAAKPNLAESETGPSKLTKSRAKKEKTPAPEEPAATDDVPVVVTKSRGAAKKEPATEKEPKARGKKTKTAEAVNKVEEEKKEAEAEPVPTAKRKGKANDLPKTSAPKKKKEIAAEATAAASTAVKSRVRGTKRLADTEIAEALDENSDDEVQDSVPVGAINKKRTKKATENADIPTVSNKKTVKSAANSKPTEPPAEKKKRGGKTVPPSNDKENGEDTKPVRGRKRAAAAVEVQDDAVDVSEPDGSKTSKVKKATPAGEIASIVYDKTDFASPANSFNLKISSWNVAGLRAWLKKGGLSFIDFEQPDIFCLQETKCANDQLPEEVVRLPGYHPYWLCMPGGYAGVAIYSKIMPIHVEYGIGNEEFDDVGRIIIAEYEKFYLINVYVPNSGRKLVNLEARMRWEKLFQKKVKDLDILKPVLICGDMNVSHSEIDLANPKTNTRNAGFTKEERDKMTELLALGYVDTFRHLYPKRTGAYTFWTYMSNARARNVGWRLDYCIVSERFVSRVVDNCMRHKCMGSDHCPITVFLNI